MLQTTLPALYSQLPACNSLQWALLLPTYLFLFYFIFLGFFCPQFLSDDQGSPVHQCPPYPYMHRFPGVSAEWVIIVQIRMLDIFLSCIQVAF